VSDADFIVLDVDGGAMLRTCIDSIKRQTVAPHRIIVFDNGSQLPVHLDDAEVLRSDVNLGFAGGVNAAFEHVKTPFVALVNNDVVLDDDWLAAVLEAMRDESVAAVQTILRRNANKLDGAGIDISDGTYRQTLDASRAWGVSATAALYRVAALGYHVFDARFFAYYEDVELCARLHEAGWQMKVVPQVMATHRGSQTAPLLGRDAVRLRTRNRYWVARMHRGVGRIPALLWEDVKLLLRGRSSLRGIIQGLFRTMNAER
jgi:GT2 family glycosyltransferase